MILLEPVIEKSKEEKPLFDITGNRWIKRTKKKKKVTTTNKGDLRREQRRKKTRKR